METYQLIASLQEILNLHRWLITKIVRKPKKALLLARLTFMRTKRRTLSSLYFNPVRPVRDKKKKFFFPVSKKEVRAAMIKIQDRFRN